MMIIAQTLSPEGYVKLLITFAILMVIVVAGFVGIWLLRKLRDGGAADQADAGFSLASLREMRDNGEITEEEYKRARTKVVAKVSEVLRPEEEEEEGDDE